MENFNTPFTTAVCTHGSTLDTAISDEVDEKRRERKMNCPTEITSLT